MLLQWVCFALSAHTLGLLQWGQVFFSSLWKLRVWLLPFFMQVLQQLPATQETSQEAHSFPQRLEITKRRAYCY